MKKNKISAVTVLYNFDEKVISNIKTYENYVDEVILIDNSDTSDYFNLYKEQLKKYTYISMNGNTGIAVALNRGIEYSKEKGYDWVITFDQDSYLRNNIIDIYENYIDKLNDDKIVILSPIYFFDRKKTEEFIGTKELKYVMQSANLVNINNFFSIGKFKEEFFIDVVDYEFCLRARQKGYKIICCGEAKLEHFPAITRESKILKIKFGYCSPLRIYYQARNLLWTAKKYKNINMLTILIYKLFKIIVFFDNKRKFLDYYFKGIKDCRKNRFGAFNENEKK